MLPILLSEFFSGRIRSFPTEIFFQTDFFSVKFFPAAIFCCCLQSFFSTGIYFQPKFILHSNFFSRNLFSGEIYFQQKFVFNRNLFSAEIYFQQKFVFNRNLFSTEIFVISHELLLTTTDHVTEEIGNRNTQSTWIFV